MDFESPDVMKDFPGLYASENKKCTNDSDYSDDNDKVTKKEILIGKRKDKKDKKDKEKGYAALEGESSAEEESPSKSKKSKSFKFTTKSKEKREKSREKEKESTEKRKEKKSDKKGEKEKTKSDKKEKKLKLNEDLLDYQNELPIFGVPLNVSVERGRCHDGVDLPLPVRTCINYVECYGLHFEGVYKITGTKSKVLNLRKMYNHRENVNLSEYDIPTITSLLKQFLRDLPEAVFTNDLLIRFEEAGAILNLATREKHLKILVDNLPQLNRLLLSWLITHFNNVVANEKHNKMNRSNIVVALSPTLHTSHRLLAALLHHGDILFPQVKIEAYTPPLTSMSQLPIELELIEMELKKQESLLTQIHAEMNAGFILKHREELLWEVQRMITQLKRNLKIAQKDRDVPDSKAKDLSEEVANESKTPSLSGDKVSLNSTEDDVQEEMRHEESPTVEEGQTNTANECEVDGKVNTNVVEDEKFALLRLKNHALNELKEMLTRQIISEQQEIKNLTTQLQAKEKLCVIPNGDLSNLDEIMDLLHKENQILQIKKIDLVRQIMEQREICIELKSKLEISAK